ncbi:hypothetical protein F5Y18DRAFT_436601 [Xylariaceae sp. FL1019]|nr:hypothetical protein F5Y18DRAFT_436601 [Xylariaceae sp. FL1019]
MPNRLVMEHPDTFAAWSGAPSTRSSSPTSSARGNESVLEDADPQSTPWTKPYPTIGQFAMTPSQEIVAAGPDGLFYFCRLLDHPSKPWSGPRPFPKTSMNPDDSTVTSLALCQPDPAHDDRPGSQCLHAYCVANGSLHEFRRDGGKADRFVPDPSPPLSNHRVVGTPYLTLVCPSSESSSATWNLVVPSQAGGLLSTATTSASLQDKGPTKWAREARVGQKLGIISAVSTAAVNYIDVMREDRDFHYYNYTGLVAACVVDGDLHFLDGPFITGKNTWVPVLYTKLPLIGEARGNPVLLSMTYGVDQKNQLDLLVPSSNGVIYHFIRLSSVSSEWHMIGQITFSQVSSATPCLSVCRDDPESRTGTMRAVVSIEGKLYQAVTTEGANP